MTLFPKTSVLCTVMALALAACGGDKHSTDPDPDPGTQPPAPEVVSQYRYMPNAGTAAGSSDASTAIALSDQWMVVGDDEANVLRVYPRAGGQAVLEWSYVDNGPKLKKELDLEASTAVGKTLYFIGSHSNKKDGADAEADRSHLFALSVTGAGSATEFAYVGKFSGLETQLLAWDTSNAHGLGASYFGFATSAAKGIAPERVDGFSIEGMTTSVDDKALWLGLRAPLTDTSTRSKALIVPVENYLALVNGSATTAVFGRPIELDLGGRGIRSLEQASDGTYLILAGPAGGSASALDQNFSLFTWDGDASNAPVELDNDLEAMRAESGGSFESIVKVAGKASPGAGTPVQLLMDNGDSIFPGKAGIAKDLPVDEQQFLGVGIELRDARVDGSGPVLKAATPADGRQGVNVDTNIALTFNEGVKPGTGSIQLRKADSTVVETFTVGSSRAQINFNVLTLRPSNKLDFNGAYYLTIDGNAILDHQGNAYAGISGNSELDFTAAGMPTPLALGDILFMGANAEAPDAFAFVTLKALNGGTQITFTDRNRKADTEFAGISNEGVFVWTADQNLPAGSIITIQTDVSASPIADKGFTLGSPAGLGKEETIFAYVGGSIADLVDGNAGEITSVGRYLASINLGGPAGDIPADLVGAGSAISFAVSPANQTNAIYAGSLDRSDLAGFAAKVKNPANWVVRYKPEAGYPITDGSLFGTP